jgi:hypothetical protein
MASRFVRLLADADPKAARLDAYERALALLGRISPESRS